MEKGRFKVDLPSSSTGDIGLKTRDNDSSALRPSLKGELLRFFRKYELVPSFT